MKTIDWLKILSNGNIEILGMRIGYTDCSFHEHLYSSCNLNPGKDCYFADNVMYDGIKSCNVRFLISNGFICGFEILKMFYNKNEAKEFYNMLYNTIHNTAIYNERKEILKPNKNPPVQYNSMDICYVTNDIVEITLSLQNGATNYNNKFFVSLRVNSIFSKFGDSVVPGKVLSSLSNMYINSEYFMKNKRLHISYSNAFKALVIIVALVLFYLYILNDRYYVSDQGRRITDKWTRTIYKCESVR